MVFGTAVPLFLRALDSTSSSDIVLKSRDVCPFIITMCILNNYSVVQNAWNFSQRSFVTFPYRNGHYLLSVIILGEITKLPNYAFSS